MFFLRFLIIIDIRIVPCCTHHAIVKANCGKALFLSAWRGSVNFAVCTFPLRLTAKYVDTSLTNNYNALMARLRPLRRNDLTLGRDSTRLWFIHRAMKCDVTTWLVVIWTVNVFRGIRAEWVWGGMVA